jgi:hypothetical protein
VTAAHADDSHAAHRDAALAFLAEPGTAQTPHIFGDLRTHLEGVESLVMAWGGSDLLALVALGHATYGTDGFPPHILELGDREVLAAVIGEEAEALVYFYASCDRSFFYPQLEDPELGLDRLRFRDRFTATELQPSGTDVTQFVDLTYANESELAAASPDGPKGWSWLADFCRRTRRWASPSFYEGAMALLGADADTDH